MTRPAEFAEVREAIVRALRLDLIGPWAGHALADERLRGWERPSNWYLTGFLVPRGAPVEQRGDADVDDEPEVAERAGLGDDSTEVEVRSAVPFVPRPDPREVSGDDRDERVADLHYAHSPEFAAGHGVSADWELVDGACRVLRTTWTPSAEVEKTETFDPPGAVLDMQALGALADGSVAEAALSPLVTGYRSWLEDRHAGLGGLTGERREVAEQLVRLARIAADRMERGIRVLAARRRLSRLHAHRGDVLRDAKRVPGPGAGGADVVRGGCSLLRHAVKRPVNGRYRTRD